MTQKIEKLLQLAADMQAFAPQEDKLNELIQNCTGDELDESDLFYVAAASSAPDYSAFLERAKNRKP